MKPIFGPSIASFLRPRTARGVRNPTLLYHPRTTAADVDGLVDAVLRIGPVVWSDLNGGRVPLQRG